MSGTRIQKPKQEETQVNKRGKLANFQVIRVRQEDEANFNTHVTSNQRNITKKSIIAKRLIS